MPHDVAQPVGPPGSDGARRGTRIAEWVLDDLAGRGTFGDVWRAHHHVWVDQVAAIKLPRDPTYLRTLRREGVVAHKLDHPGVVRALGLDPFAEVPYLVMEYVPGTTLRQVLRDKGRLSPDESSGVLAHVLAALDHAHSRGIVHRDVKPENVLIHENALRGGVLDFAGEGVVKLTDFGLGVAEHAAQEAQGDGGSLVFSTDGTAGGASAAVAGSLDYMAPEQRAGGNVDGRADLYACGVMLFEMLTGERPAGTDVPSDLVEGIPQRFDDAFRHSYARLGNRFGKAAEFLAALSPTSTLHLKGKDQPTLVGACTGCGGRTDPDDQFCMRGGKQLVESVRRCHSCGAFPTAGDKFCMFCGTGLTADATTSTTA